jgi:hypothetical protein
LIGYERGTLRLDVSVVVGNAHGPREQRDDVRDAHIAISGVVFVIDPPSSAAGYAFKSPGELWIADGYETRSIPECTETIGKKLLHSVPGEAFVQSFFIRDWNSYVHVSATDRAMKWVGAARHYEGPRQVVRPGEMVDQ